MSDKTPAKEALKDRPTVVGNPDAPEAEEQKESKAQQEREAEYRRSGRLPAGYGFNVYKGVHKLEKHK